MSTSCETCRWSRVTERGHLDCIALGNPMPCQFCRRPNGICGLSLKMYEHKHEPKESKDDRRN
jgi:hypothetical protein